MEKRKEPSMTIQDFEQKADTLLSTMFALTEQRISAAAKLKKPLDSALPSAALTVQTSIQCFIALERMNNQ